MTLFKTVFSFKHKDIAINQKKIYNIIGDA